MRITLPERITGARDALFVLEIECPAAPVERRLEVATRGPVEALDLRGTGPGGRYVVPAGLDRVHVPLRVTADGAGEAEVQVRCLEGPESGRSESRTVRLDAADAAVGGGRSRFAVAAVVLLALVGVGVVYGPRLLGGDKHKVPSYVGQDGRAAAEAAKGAKFAVRIKHEDVGSADQDGKVVRQVPAAGLESASGATLELVIGQYTGALKEVQDLVGADAIDAEAALRAAGFQSLVSYQDVADPKRAGKVLRMSPEGGTALDKGHVVELFVGRTPGAATPTPPPPAPAPTPPGPGSPDGTEPGPTAPPAPPPPTPEPPPTPPAPTPPAPTPPAPTPPAPTPPAPTPPAPTPPAPTPPAPVAQGILVPDLKGLTKSEAEWQLLDLHLDLETEYSPTADAAQLGKVLRQSPAPGERVARMTRVRLVVGQKAEPAAPVPSIPPAPAIEPGPMPAPPAPTPPAPTPPAPTPPAPTPPAPTPPAPAPPAPTPPAPTPPAPTPPDPTPPAPTPPAPTPPPPTPPAPTPPAPTPPPAPPKPPEDVVPGKVPDAIGLWREAAEGLVRRAGYYYQIVLKQTADLEDGRVLAQDPHPGEALAPGGTVMLEVARTPVAPGVTVPDVKGLAFDEANQRMRELGLAVRAADGAGTADQQGRIVSQTPAAGTDVAKGSWVVLVIARSLTSTAPAPSSGLAQPPAVGPGAPVPVVSTPRSATTPLPAVRLPARDAAPTASVPAVEGQAARAAIDAVIKAGLMPIVEMDRTPGGVAGSVRTQRPAAGTPARLADLVYLGVGVGNVAGERSVSIPVATGADAAQAQRLFAQHGLSVEVVELDVPTHPYAGTGRIVAQYPVSTVPVGVGRVVTLWVVK